MNTGIERVLGEFAARQFAEAFVTISHHLRSLQLLLGLIQLSLLLERLKQQPVTLIIIGQLDDRALQRQLRFRDRPSDRSNWPSVRRQRP